MGAEDSDSDSYIAETGKRAQEHHHRKCGDTEAGGYGAGGVDDASSSSSGASLPVPESDRGRNLD